MGCVLGMKTLRGDLSAPVLAIIVTIGIISAGMLLLAWFWWFAPTIGQTGALIVVGQPALVCTGTGNKTSHAYISVKNVGNAPVKIEQVVVGGYGGNIVSSDTSVEGGESVVIEVEFSEELCNVIGGNRTVEGVIVTSSGTYSTTLLVIK